MELIMAQKEALSREREVFEAHLEEWRQTKLGQYVLIKDDQVVGFFPFLGAAFSTGTKEFGLQEFFVKQILPGDAVNVSLFGKKLRSA